MLPYQQGGLDALCGIYSILNADHLINNTSEKDSEKLFKTMIKYLDKNKQLASILTDGMILKNVKKLLINIIGDRISYQKIHFSGITNPDLDSFWNDMYNFLHGKKKRAIILSLWGVHEHWTVIENITEKQIKLFDSDNLKSLRRINLTTADAKKNRPHEIYPAQTYFLKNE